MKIAKMKTAHPLKVGREETDMLNADKHCLEIELIGIKVKAADGSAIVQQMIKITPLKHPTRGPKRDIVYTSLLNVAWWVLEEEPEEPKKRGPGRPKVASGVAG